VELAGIRVRLRAPDAWLGGALGAAMRPFAIEPAGASADLEVEVSETDDPIGDGFRSEPTGTRGRSEPDRDPTPTPTRIGSEPDRNRLPVGSDRIPSYDVSLARAGDALAVRGPWLDGTLDLARGRGRARVDAFDASGSVENFLRVAIAHLLLPRGGFLLHACAAVTGDGGAIVGFGPSDAGKTTLASLAGARPVVSDDLLALTRDANGRLAVVPTPFRAGGARPHPAGHPVRALCRLRKSATATPSLTRLAPARGAMELAAAMPFVVDEPATADAALALAAEAARDPGVHELAFAPTPEAWSFVEARL